MTTRFPLSRSCRASDWQHRPLLARMESVTGCPQPPHLAHRKAWEFGVGVLALEAGCVLKESSVGLSTGAGHEAILYWLASRVSSLHATDIYGEGDFASGESSDLMLADPDLFAPFPYRSEGLKVSQMNALDLRFPSGSLDFAISFGSIEHFGGYGAAAHALGEMARVVRPGGVIFITTEMVADGGGGASLPGLELFTADALCSMVEETADVEWLGSVDMRPPPPGDHVVDLVTEIRRIEMGVQSYPHRLIGVHDPASGYRNFTSVSLSLTRT